MKATCETCNREFHKPPSHILRSLHHFCSRECNHKFKLGRSIHSQEHKEHLSDHMKGNTFGGDPRINLTCDHCDKEFSKYPSAVNSTHNYCSRLCYAATKVGHIPWNKGKPWPKEIRDKISIATKEAMKDPKIRASCVRGALIHLERAWTGFTSIEKAMIEEFKHRNIKPATQFRLYDNSKLVGVVDFAFPEKKLIVECYGDYWHANPEIYASKELTKTQERVIAKDQIKQTWALNNEWKLLYFYGSEIRSNVKECVDKVELLA